MISKLAKSSIEQLKSEGLEPSFEDIVLLNALGLKVERGDDSYDFSSLPRLAFIGDIVIYEPTVRKKLWIDNAFRLLADSIENQVYIMIFALHYEMEQLPTLNNTKVLTDAITKFVEEYLMDSTDTQIFYALDYVMNGNEHIDDEDYRLNKDKQSAYEIPNEIRSNAQQLIVSANMAGVESSAIDLATIPMLERMIDVAYMQKGSDILKNQRVQNAGKYYSVFGQIRTRLQKVKENG